MLTPVIHRRNPKAQKKTAKYNMCGAVPEQIQQTSTLFGRYVVFGDKRKRF